VTFPAISNFLNSKIEAILLSALPKDTTSELASLSPHNPVLVLNVEQESCEYQLLKTFGPTGQTNQGIKARSSNFEPDAL